MNHDILSLIVLTLGDAAKTDQEILQLLDTEFTSDLTTDEISTTLKNDFGLVLTPKMEQELSEMCNLSIGIEERGIAKGFSQGMSQGMSQGIPQGEEKKAREVNRKLRFVLPTLKLEQTQSVIQLKS